MRPVRKAAPAQAARSARTPRPGTYPQAQDGALPRVRKPVQGQGAVPPPLQPDEKVKEPRKVHRPGLWEAPPVPGKALL